MNRNAFSSSLLLLYGLRVRVSIRVGGLTLGLGLALGLRYRVRARVQWRAQDWVEGVSGQLFEFL